MISKEVMAICTYVEFLLMQKQTEFLYLYTRVLNIQSCLLFVHIPKWTDITKAFRKSGTQRFSTGQDEKWTCCKSECYVLCKKAHIYQYKEQNSSNWQLVITQNGRKVYFKLVEPSKRGKKEEHEQQLSPPHFSVPLSVYTFAEILI